MKQRNINIKDKIKEHFFVSPESKLRVREIEKLLKLPLPSVIRYCKELEKEGILTRIFIGNVIFYTADRSNAIFLLEKRVNNIKSLYLSGLAEYLVREFSNPPIIVFGSYSKGEDTEKSDIDLYLETPSKKEITLEKFEQKLKRKIQLFKYRSINEIKNIHLANNIINGTTLNGFIEVLK